MGGYIGFQCCVVQRKIEYPCLQGCVLSLGLQNFQVFLCRFWTYFLTYYFVCVPYMVTRFAVNVLILNKLFILICKFSLLFPFLAICRIEYLKTYCITCLNILFIRGFFLVLILKYCALLLLLVLGLAFFLIAATITQ